MTRPQIAVARGIEQQLDALPLDDRIEVLVSLLVWLGPAIQDARERVEYEETRSIGDLLLFAQAYVGARRSNLSPMAAADCAASEVFLLRSVDVGKLSPAARILVEGMR